MSPILTFTLKKRREKEERKREREQQRKRKRKEWQRDRNRKREREKERLPIGCEINVISKRERLMVNFIVDCGTLPYPTMSFHHPSTKIGSKFRYFKKLAKISVQ
jgi:hypothetical protein